MGSSGPVLFLGNTGTFLSKFYILVDSIIYYPRGISLQYKSDVVTGLC